MIFPVGQCLRRTHHDRIAGVHTNGVKIFHVADGDGGVVFVAHHLIFDLFEAFYAFFDKHLIYRRKRKSVFQKRQQLGLVIRKPAAGSAQRKGGAQYNGISYLFGDFNALFYRACNVGGQNRFSKAFAQLLELFSVLGTFNAGTFGSQ